MPTQTTETAHRLSRLIEETRAAATRSRRIRADELLSRCRAIGQNLDAARTHLVTIGSRYLPTAEAFEVAATLDLGHIVGTLDTLDTGVDAIAAGRVEAGDVVAWIDLHGIHLYPYQRRAIARHAAPEGR
ncbi:hypothetical protein LTDYDHKI_CDS0027 [Exiguobacterium phage phiExGM16]|uniref:hypothetical protein n=1 Tax=Bacillati TaxID=1783272 RepID=UPI00325440DF